MSGSKLIASLPRMITGLGAALVMLAGCASRDFAAANKAASAVVLSRPEIRVAFDSFVNVHYGKTRSLHGWKTTQTAIETTLMQWYPNLEVRQTLIDGTPEQLGEFLRRLPGPEDCDISIVYLGSIQSPQAEWEFVDGRREQWRTRLAASPPPTHHCRIVILDACHAAAVQHIPAWAEQFGTITLLASARDELTYDFAPSAMTPIDLRKHLPAVESWAQTHLPPEWNRRISYLGLIWIQTAAQTEYPPADVAGWWQWAAACRENAAAFRQTISRRWGATVTPYTRSKIR